MEENSPRHAFNILGHDEAIDHFYTLYDAGRLPHSWLITGPQGIGKASLAFYFARIVLQGEDPQSPIGRRISADTHGDLLYISRQRNKETGNLRKEISVEDIRKVTHFFHHTSTEGGWRVAIIDSIEYFNRHSANALLKILEEPPPKSLLILTASSLGRILPTLLSRCRRLALTPLNSDEMRALLPNLSEDLVEKAQGIPGRAVFLSQDKEAEIAHLVQQAFKKNPLNGEIWEKIKQIARREEGFPLFCEMLRDTLTQEFYHHAGRNHLKEANHLVLKMSEILKLKQQTESFSLDKAQAMRHIFEKIAS